MNSSRMDLLDFLTEDELMQFFHCKKTEMSCMEDPQTFLRQLRDHDLVPVELYKKVIKMKNKERKQKGVYEILDWVENNREQYMKLFWSCVFQDHILRKYPVFRLLQKSLLDGSFRIHENLLNADKKNSKKEAEGEEKKQEEHKTAPKRKRSSEETDDEETGPSSVSSQKKPAMKPEISPLLKSGTLPVTCGDKKGILYPDKLAKGAKCNCIRSQDRWFTTNDFERFSGRGSSKNWKLTIRYQNTPLQKLLKEGHLQCPHSHKGGGQKKVSFSSGPEEPSSSSIQQDSERADSSKFVTSALPVSCGSVSGFLYKSRFTGSRSKSIRTEERWFTPEEFVMQESTLTDGHWKKDILYRGNTLDYLVKKKILEIHPQSCSCHVCCPKNNWEQDNDDVCYVCNTGVNLVCCDKCPRVFHHHCHLPTLQDDTLGDEWICTFCVLKANHRLWIHMSRKGALDSPVSMNIMRCEYLLLRLYKAATNQMFAHDPTEKEPRYSSMISDPMWLDKVKIKLQKNEYRTVGQFVNDIDVTFNNNKTFNKDNWGDKLKKKFEEDFNTIFKIE